MPAQGGEVSLPLRHAAVSCQMLYRSSFLEIERDILAVAG